MYMVQVLAEPLVPADHLASQVVVRRVFVTKDRQHCHVQLPLGAKIHNQFPRGPVTFRKSLRRHSV